MLFVRRYKNLRTKLDSFYRDILDELRKEKELRIANELCGCINGKKQFKSVTAVKACVPRDLEGTLREVTITITGSSEDFYVEAHIGTWLKSSVSTDVSKRRNKTKLNKSLTRVGYTPILDYRKDLIRRVDELVRKNSGEEFTSKKVERVYA